MSSRIQAVAVLFLLASVSEISGNMEARRLYHDLMSNYSKLVRPVSNSSESLIVKLGLKLTQLIAVDEKNQVMTTNVWLGHEWMDVYLKWNKEDYGGVDHLYIPADDLWKPDIVLYNNADGNFEVTLSTKATVHYDGRVDWNPPAIYKSSCEIDVEFFPFDEQSCPMKFSSWTYVQDQVDLKHMNQADIAGEVDIEEAIDMSDYYASFIWDVMNVPARRNEVIYPCCPEIYPDITFKLTIRRKTLFYTVNLIIPCVAISFLTVLVFYLPSDSGEKITLCISILLSLTVFFLLLSELIPPTSLVIPLIGKYLLFTMILVTLSIIVTVGVLNLHYRSMNTHTMPEWVRVLFLEKLPRYLLMKRPTHMEDKTQQYYKKEREKKAVAKKSSNSLGKRNGIEMESLLADARNNLSGVKDSTGGRWNLDPPGSFGDSQSHRQHALSERELSALEGIQFIAEHHRDERDDFQVSEDWKYMAMVVDRLFLWLFTIACCIGTLSIFLRAPTLFDNAQPHAQNSGKT